MLHLYYKEYNTVCILKSTYIRKYKTIFSEKYIKNLKLPGHSHKTNISKEARIYYIKVHLELSIKYKANDHLVYFLNLLKSNRSELGLGLYDIYDIIHNQDVKLRSSYLNYANQNKDKTAAKILLECERKVHSNDQSALKRCIREMKI